MPDGNGHPMRWPTGTARKYIKPQLLGFMGGGLRPGDFWGIFKKLQDGGDPASPTFLGFI